MQVYVFWPGRGKDEKTHERLPLPNSEKWATEFDIILHYHENDKDANKLFSKCKPDVIVTIAENACNAFPVLLRMPRFICRRWLNFAKPDDVLADYIQNCFYDALQKQVGPEISLFTTSYKSMEKIKRPYESLLAQTLQEWEWVILDDSPDDMTWNAFLVPLAEQDCRIRIYRGKNNDGFIGSVKRDAASLCRAPYFVELDHDDALCKQALELIVNAFNKHPEVGLIGTDCIELYESRDDFSYGDHYGMGFHSYAKERHEGRWVSVARNGPLNQFTLRHIVGVYNHARAVRATAYFELTGGHDHRLYVADDFDLIIRMFCSRWRVAKLPVFLYKQYRNNGGDNFTNHRNHYIQRLVTALRNIHNDAIHKRLLELKQPDEVWPDKYHSPEDMAFLEWVHHPTADLVLDPSPETIAIVTPTFNRKKLLCRAVKSVLRQDLKNWVLYIIGDKCPTLDKTMQEKGYMHDPRIRYWNLSENRGSGIYPRNYALHTLVTKKRVAYLDDDNVWETNHLSSLYRAITRTKSADGRTPRFAFSSFVFEEKGESKLKVKCSEPKLYRIDTSTLLHEMSLLQEYRYWRPEKVCGYAVDWDLVQPWVAGKEPWVATKKFTLRYNNTKQNMEGIRGAYDDQGGDEEDEQEEEKTQQEHETAPPTKLISLEEAIDDPNFCPECMCIHDKEEEEDTTTSDQTTAGTTGPASANTSSVFLEEPCVITVHEREEKHNEEDSFANSFASSLVSDREAEEAPNPTIVPEETDEIDDVIRLRTPNPTIVPEETDEIDDVIRFLNQPPTPKEEEAVD